MAITATAVKELRELTGAGMLDCKEALEEADGDVEKAKLILKQKGIDIAASRGGRTTAEGVIHSYIHHNGRLGVLLEINCETDFVARTEDFRALAQKIAVHIAGAAPLYVSEEDVPAAEDADPKEFALLSQPYVQDPEVTIADMVQETIGKTGENIRVLRFARFELGGA